MVLLDEKSAMLLPPPPPYIQLNTYTPLTPPPPFYEPRRHRNLTLCQLPAHILLQIIHLTFPQSASVDFNKTQRQRRTLHWLESELRLVNRVFYIACMHVLRSTYLPAYESLVKRPYSSDPFPMLLPSPTAPSSPATGSIQRETVVLDLFISLKVREDVWADDTEFHLESEERFRDLFELMQPKSRLEDLLRAYGERHSVVTTKLTGKRDQVEFWRLSVGFTPRVVSLIYQPDGGPRKKWFEVQRESREESLEVTAKRIVKELERRLHR